MSFIRLEQAAYIPSFLLLFYFIYFRLCAYFLRWWPAMAKSFDKNASRSKLTIWWFVASSVVLLGRLLRWGIDEEQGSNWLEKLKQSVEARRAKSSVTKILIFFLAVPSISQTRGDQLPSSDEWWVRRHRDSFMRLCCRQPSSTQVPITAPFNLPTKVYQVSRDPGPSILHFFFLSPQRVHSS